MIEDFEIIKMVTHHNRGQFIFARYKGINDNLDVKVGAILEAIPVYHYKEMPLSKDENQQPRPDVFVFRPVMLSWLPYDYFKEGQAVKLISQEEFPELHMTTEKLQDLIETAANKLLEMSKNATKNKYSNNYKFILSEISENTVDFNSKRKLRIIENAAKKPLVLKEIIDELHAFYYGIYDINLHIYLAERNVTIIDIRYYLKCSLEHEYRQTVINNIPMLHCKLLMPPWLSNHKEQFDVNWEHYEGMSWCRLIWLKVKLKIKGTKCL